MGMGTGIGIPRPLRRVQKCKFLVLLGRVRLTGLELYQRSPSLFVST